MRRFDIVFPILPLIAVVFVIFLFLFVLHRSQMPGFSAADLSESAGLLKNPYQGFYRIFRYDLSDETALPGDALQTYPYTLALLEINLRAYRRGDIPAAGLTGLEAILEQWVQSGVQVIVRFVYDWDGMAKATEPESLTVILKHMDQVSRVVNRYADSVYLMQGVFIGNWGEMHSSFFADDRSVKTLMTHLHQVMDPGIYLSVRTPAQWRMVTGLRDVTIQGQSSLAGRLGLFNDGMLGSATDLGTYGDTPRGAELSRKGTREEELAFQNRLCQYVPNGGEVVGSTAYSDLSAAVQTMKTTHVSYLNADYDRTVLEKWQRASWEGDDAFRGCDGLTYVQAHLGYRFTARDAALQRRGILRPRLRFRVSLENTGFSNTLRPFSPAFLLRDSRTGAVRTVPIRFDLRELKSGQTLTLTAEILLAELPRNTCELYFSVTDAATGGRIALANTTYMDGIGVLLGRLEL